MFFGRILIYFFVFAPQCMANGQTGARGGRALSRVVQVANHAHARAQTLHQPMVDKTVRERVHRHEPVHVVPRVVSNNFFKCFKMLAVFLAIHHNR
jgi:hypothetical protein